MSRTAYELSDWQGYLTRPEIDFLKELARELPESPVIINIGAGAGTSTLSFLEEREDAVVFSVDIKADESEVTTNEHLRLSEVSLDKANRAIRIWGDSKIVGKAWPYFVDMVFVDGDHSKEGVYGDIVAWYPKIKIGGIIAFHDYGSERWTAVKYVVDKAMIQKYAIGTIGSVKAFRS